MPAGGLLLRHQHGHQSVRSTFSQNTDGRLAAVRYMGGYKPGQFGYPGTCDTTFTEMYSYNPAGAPLKKRLQVTRTIPSPYPGFPYNTTVSTVTLDSSYAYDNEGRMTNQQYPPSGGVTGPNMSYTYDAMGRLQTMTEQGAQQSIVTRGGVCPHNSRRFRRSASSEARANRFKPSRSPLSI